MKKNILGFLLLCLFILYSRTIVFAGELAWENIGKEISEVNAVLIDKVNPRFIYMGTKRGVFKSEDRGYSWRMAGAMIKDVNFLLEDNRGVIYAAVKGGLFISEDQAKSWKRIFRGKNAADNNCKVLAVLNDGEIYLGTDSGIFTSKDRGRTWHKGRGKLSNVSILSIAVGPYRKIIYVVAENKVFKLGEGFTDYTEIFNAGSGKIELDADDNEDAAEDSISVNSKIRYIAVTTNTPNRIYLATESGIYLSENEGVRWDLMTAYGLLSKKIQFILVSPSSELYAVSGSGIFVYKDERWQELSLRLPPADIRFLSADNQGDLYAASDKGLFKAKQEDFSFANNREMPEYFKNEPTIKELHKAAIEYVQVINPRKIENLRSQARVKAILPEVSVDYDRTITSYANSSSTRFEVGPSDWGVSLKWSLSDLIWSEQQRLIDGQARLMVVLRNDILDEVNKIYFERRRVKIELANLSYQDERKLWEKKIKLEELTASLDALTGGYFSQHLKN